ncbi:MAG: hypothetical protein MK105_04775 [Crocinitomicaceae bacterium]|nr:hypothetical protein [Crocinitomicaceae bacterium]
MKQILVLFAGLILFASCDKFIATDISKLTPSVILPASNDTVQINPVHFKWDEIDGATDYHLEVVSLGFSSISSFDLDTLIQGGDFYFALDSNEYEMRLTATNGAYDSQTTLPIKFWVGVQPDEGGTSVELITPASNVYVNETFNGFFDWTTIANVDSYEISIRKGAVFSSGVLVDSEIGNTTGNFTSNEVFEEGEYTWGVLAQFSNGTATSYSTSTFYVDTVTPNVPAQSTPANLSNNTAGLIPFSWSNGQDSGVIMSPINSEIEVSTDITFPAALTDVYQVQGELADINLTSGTYFWRIRNVDEAGNQSVYSTTIQFQVQ